MLSNIAQVQTNDRNLNQVQQNVAKALTPVVGNPILSGIFLEDVALATGDNTVNHKLGRNLKGWIITRRDGTATVYDKQATNTVPNLTLVLTASATVTVSLYVF